ncbi:hypothetical protein SDRG_11879 [Saprolegnia diclina VS20]|uniref:Uncharacterized protein n=1 Tax=Saprolegnia diclina (strain VS20) TaxID=1156394 RepID=T0RK29_SAPDV|nr:hypothetical protein SDRG_11879 [Saprolegnia diclina VS20]EQC30302.1 hypothetical protein SDRG_11879 [Saprolegnia diclina VS20]|eukprot:XP_008616155.1 hypothetical protein SDRG_11879 [Saprolegnia diclina VS20]
MRAPSVHLIVQPPSRAESLLDWLGLAYLLFSLVLSVYCVLLFGPYTSNRFFWPDFDTDSNVTHALGWRFNMELGVTSALLPAPFSLSTAAVRRTTSEDVICAIYPRLVLHTDLATIEAGIAGLRRLSNVLVMYLPTSYCFVDLARRWSLAHTAARDRRCRALYAANGAVVFETTLRNVDLPSWLQQHSALAMERIGYGVASLPGGTEWLNTMDNHSVVSMPIEAAIWRTAGLAYYDVSYSNRVVHGLDEAIAITNALGYETQFSIKALTQFIPRGAWTTSYLQSVLGYDLAALQTNQSLVRSSALFFGHTMPNQIEAYVLGYPLNALQMAVHTYLGPLASVDQRWVPPPMRLVDAVQRLAGTIAAALSQDTTLLAAYEAIPRLLLTPTPTTWADLLFYSGSPLCLYGSPGPFALESFRFDDACDVQRPLQIQLAPLSSLFAMAVLNGTVEDGACLLCPPPQRADCRRHLQAVQLLYTRLQARALIRVESNVVSDADDVSILQMVANASTPNDIQMATAAVLEGPWTFFGLGSLVDWATISREVVVFEGDVATLRLLSAMSMPVSQDLPKRDGMGSSAIYLWYASALVSLGLVLVACLLVCIKIHRPHLASRWWLFSPIVGPVWVGRSLLLVRSGTALICLATAPLDANVQTTLLQLGFQPAFSLFSQCTQALGAPPSLHFSAAAVHCLPARTLCSGAPLSAVTAGMCGLFQYAWHTRHYLFNSKLWHHLPSPQTTVPFAVPDDISSKVLSMGVLPPPPRTTVVRHWLGVGVGLTYLVLTLLGNVTYLSIVLESLANDFMWAGFNSSGVYPFLANQLNQILDTTNDSLVALADGTYADTTQAYDVPDASILFPPTSARRWLYAPSQALEDIVTLRLNAWELAPALGRWE